MTCDPAGRSELAEALAAFDADTRAIARTFWDAHGLPGLDDCDDAQLALVAEWVAFITDTAPVFPPLSAEPAPVPIVPLGPMPDDAVFHECGPVLAAFGMRYRRWVLPGVPCDDCGYDPAAPVPDLDGCRQRLVGLLGLDDARVWAKALTELLEEVS